MKKIIRGYLLLTSILFFTACGPETFNGSRTGDENQFIIEYETFNGTDEQLLHLELGDQVAIKIVVDAGEVGVEVRKDNEEPIYSGTLTSDLSFTLGISKSGNYKCTVIGKKAKGSVSFIKEERKED